MLLSYGYAITGTPSYTERSFVFDADIGTGGSFLSIDITTFDNIGNSIATYGDPLPLSPGNNIVLIAIPDDTVADLTNEPFLALNFEFALTNAGGLIDILPGFDPNFSFESVCISANCGSFSTGIDNLREVTAGQVAAPEPGTLALFGIGLVGLGIMSRRRRKAA